MRKSPAVQSSRRLPAPARRRFVSRLAALAGVPVLGLGSRAAIGSESRVLAFVHTHTGERLTLAYAAAGTYVAAALDRLAWFLRDFRTNALHPIDPALFDQLHTLAQVTGSRMPYEVISGYRSPITNAALRAHSHGVAEHSLHLEGRAIDVRLADVPLEDLRDAARSLQAGGVGYYAQSRFVHLDTGRVRHW